MSKVKMLLVAAIAAAFGVAFGGSALAQLDLPGMDAPKENTGGLVGPAVGELGNAEHGECVEDLLNIPAIDSCRDAEGRVIMDLPGLELVGPRELPETGMNVGDFAAIGAAALAAGFVLRRRVLSALAS